MAMSCANLIQGRCQRLMQVVLSDIGDHPTRYSHEHVHQIEQQMKKLREKSKLISLISIWMLYACYICYIHGCCNDNDFLMRMILSL